MMMYKTYIILWHKSFVKKKQLQVFYALCVVKISKKNILNWYYLPNACLVTYTRQPIITNCNFVATLKSNLRLEKQGKIALLIFANILKKICFI